MNQASPDMETEMMNKHTKDTWSTSNQITSQASHTYQIGKKIKSVNIKYKT